VRHHIAVTQLNVENLDAMAFVLSCVGMLCQIICFWWMDRISSRQDALLKGAA
jgi:hypothetical protein